MAARGARTAGGAGGRFPQSDVALGLSKRHCSIPPGPERERLHRRPERENRVPLGRGPQRTASLRSPPKLAARGVNVIAATGGEASAFAAKTATKTIPIVFNSGGDPVRTGLVDSLSRPSGNMTGVSRINTELLPKRLKLISEVAPAGRAIAILMNPTTRGHDVRVGEIQSAARLIGREVTVLRASSEPEIDAAFTALMEARAGALLVTNDAFFNSRSAYLGGLVARHAVPAIYQNREFADAGGLMSYGPSLAAAYRVVGEYAGRILKGAKPADLPVQQQTKVDFFINLRTARLLGLTIPLPVVSLADEVIE